MNLTSWGRYPCIAAKVMSPRTPEATDCFILNHDAFIARGLGRSYGDSALAENVLCLRFQDHFISFDPSNGVLTAEAGVSLKDIAETFMPRGWFLPVTPGTQFVTLGGAIASDVHGKNHHLDGCFSEYVLSFQLMLADGSCLECSREAYPELFHATCGGMGLTGVILQVRLRLKKIDSAFIDETVIKACDLTEVFELFEKHHAASYSVAWIDCLAKGPSLGRSLVMLGEHAKEGELNIPLRKKIKIPLDMPTWLLNAHTITAFNALYYHKQRESVIYHRVPYDKFFYPLDRLYAWNRLYGKHGFTQYQFVLPKAVSFEGMTKILEKITSSRRGSFLSVLKACGPQNHNFLSFPIEGYSLALDFKIEPGLFALLDELDEMVADYGGRVYLTKDARMSEKIFKQTYQQWQKFLTVRQHYGADKKFHSLQSQRLGL